MSIGFEHPNVKVHIGDGLEFLRDKTNQYDVIITDSSDPDGKKERSVHSLHIYIYLYII